MHAQDIYVKLIDPTGVREPVVNYHRVWDKDKFLAAQKQQHEVRAEDDDKRVVELTSESEYQRYNRRK